MQYGGGLAEYVVAPIKTTVKRTPGVSTENGAGLPTAAPTELQAIQGSAGIKLDGMMNDGLQ